MKQSFNIAAEQARLAKEFFTKKYFIEEMGNDFVKKLEHAIQEHIIGRGQTLCAVNLTYAMPVPFNVERDMPYIQKAFQKIKEKYPEMDNFCVRGDDVVMDTKPNTFLRRLECRFGIVDPR